MHEWQRPTLYYTYPYMANCNVPMIETVPVQNTMICCNALPVQYAHTNTHNTDTRAHHSKPTQTTYAHCIRICTNALYMVCNSIETATVAPLYVLSATTEIPHWTTSHHLPPPPNMSLLVSNITSVQFTSMSDGHFSIIIRIVYYASH